VNRNPFLLILQIREQWIPAFAGMTVGAGMTPGTGSEKLEHQVSLFIIHCSLFSE
jgi:hypothetical protein